MSLSREELTDLYLQLQGEHLALKVVTMTMIGMMPLKIRSQIAVLLTPDPDEYLSRAPTNFDRALRELLDDLQGEGEPREEPPAEDMSHIL